MSETRIAPRESCFARVILEGLAVYGHVADTSPGGLKVRVPGIVPNDPADREVLLIAFDDMGIAPFSVSGELRWSKRESNSTLFGFAISEFTDEGCRARYERLRSYYECMADKDAGAVECH